MAFLDENGLAELWSIIKASAVGVARSSISGVTDYASLPYGITEGVYSGLKTNDPFSEAGAKRIWTLRMYGSSTAVSTIIAICLDGGNDTGRMFIGSLVSGTFKWKEHFSKTHTATITATWTASGDYFYQDIGIQGILASDNPIVDIVCGSDNAANILYSEGICKVFRIVTFANGIRVWATEAISTAIPIQLKVVR